MLSEFHLSKFVGVEAFSEIQHHAPTGFFVLLAILWCLSVGRYFKSYRTKKDGEPPMLPYLFPIIGHTASFVQNSEALITYGRKFFGDTRKIFSINLINATIYVVTNPHHVSAIHANTSVFALRRYLELVLISFKHSRKGAEAIIRPLNDSAEKDESKMETVIQALHNFQARQTSGSDLVGLAQHITHFLDDCLLADNVLSNSEIHNGTRCMSLKNWGRDIIIRAMQDAYFGPKLMEVSPSLPRDVMEFSEVSWQAWYQYPWFMRRRFDRSTTAIRTAFQRYIELPEQERQSHAWFTKEMEEKLRGTGNSVQDISVFLQFFHWGITMNTANVVFWLVAHIVSEPELIDIIRAETAPAFRPDGKVDTYYLVNSCPRLASVWHECLRLYASVTTLRYITEDTTLDSKKLKQGNAVLFSARQLAFNEDVFGANYQNFDNMRFFRDPKLQHSNSFRPFGGGKFMCPGRHLSKHVHFAFAAILLRRYDVSCAFPQTMPKPLENEPAIGVLMSPEDFFVNLKPRSEGV